MNELPDVGHGVEPDVAGLGIGNQLGQRVEVRHLIPIGISHLMPGEDEPPMVLDRGVKLGASFAVPLEQLGLDDRTAFEFQRTISRLVEMQSEEYLATALRDEPSVVVG